MSVRVPEISKPVVTNVVATASLNTKVDLRTLAVFGHNVKYNNKNSYAVCRMHHPVTTIARVYQSGKITILGAPSVEDASNAMRQYAKMIRWAAKRSNSEESRLLGFPCLTAHKKVHLSDFRVDNLAATVRTGYKIRLSKLQAEISKLARHNKPVSCKYDPDTCPQLILYLTDNNSSITMMIFASGSIVITGSKCVNTTNEAY